MTGRVGRSRHADSDSHPVAISDLGEGGSSGGQWRSAAVRIEGFGGGGRSVVGDQVEGAAAATGGGVGGVEDREEAKELDGWVDHQRRWVTTGA
jgi:hypothetical protein